MSVMEDLIAAIGRNTAAIDKLNAALLSRSGKSDAATSGKAKAAAASTDDDEDDDAPAEAPKRRGRPPKDSAAASDAPKIDAQTVKDAVLKVKRDKGMEAAQDIISKVGKAEKLALIDAKRFSAVLAACETALAGGDDEEDDEDEDI